MDYRKYYKTEFAKLIRKIKYLHKNSVTTDQYIIRRLKNQRDELISYINEFDDVIFCAIGNNKFGIITNIRHIYEVAFNCIEMYFHGHFDKSREIIYNAFFNKSNRNRILLRYDNISSGTLFYRMRCNETHDLYSPLEMFHIPFEKRSLTTNQRYSISGYPCLYLGNSVYGCWEELNRPDINMCNIVALDNVGKLTVIDLSLGNMHSGRFVEEDIYNMTLSLICSLKVNDRKSPFKPEYIIPQTLLSCMISRNDNFNQIYCDGIKYTSSLYGGERNLFNNIGLFDNYVIPIKRSSEKGHCSKLSNLFAISATVSIATNKILNPYVNNYAGFSGPYNYDHSDFGLIEQQLLHSRKILVAEL